VIGAHADLTEAFIEDGGQTAEDVAARVIAFVDDAKQSLDVAIYDFEARSGASAKIGDALERASSRGVAVRVVFNFEPCDNPADSRPMKGEPALIDGLEVPTRGVSEQGELMHHKYIVRDGISVWTGSMNWTDDAFTREENVMLDAASADLAAVFARNFDRLWTKGKIEGTGASGPEVRLSHGVVVRPYFSPHPPFLSQVTTQRIVEANRRIRIVSPVITSGAVIGTLCEHIVRRKLDVGGAYDHTQMEEVQRTWAGVPHNRWKIDAWKVVAPYLSGKISTPYSPTAVHDYMHAKFVVVDDEVIAGSYNLSKHGEINAENVLHIVSEWHAVRFTEFADRVQARYARGPAAASAITS
jgi:phosphatidylserine/phosphatidylglycerophosphate/cardiolipin synthase-like enzyme